LGESLARRFLTDHGLSILASNVRVEGGEIDLVALDRGQKVAIEVRAITGQGDPIDAVDPVKRRKVRRLAHQTGASRVDFIGIAIETGAAVVHWVPGRV